MSLFKSVSRQCLSQTSRGYIVPLSVLSSPQAARWHSSSCSNNTLPPLHTRSSPIRNRTIPQTFARTRRRFSASTIDRHAHLDPPKPGEELHVTFIDKDGEEHKLEVADGDNLLDIAQFHDLEMEGACGGSCACSTCHVIVSSEDYYEKMEEPSDDENDMLDLAFGLTETSRLGCQIKMSKALDGLEVKLPSMTRNLQASDFNAAGKKS